MLHTVIATAHHPIQPFWLSTRISHGALKKAFAWFLVVVATYILFKSVIGG